MADAPERIWATGDGVNGSWTHQPLPEKWGAAASEYIRADLYTALTARLAEVEAELRFHVDDAVKAWNAHEAAEAALATARADALREAAHKLGEVAKKHSAGRAEIIKAVGRAILALIDRPADPTPPHRRSPLEHERDEG